MVFIIVVIFVWLTSISVLVLLLRNHYRRLIEVGGKRDLEGILEKILDKQEEDRLSIEKINKTLLKLTTDAGIYIQKVGLVRFNPFPDTGGDQSFALSLLDKNNNGIVISSLHARTTTRWYAKRVVSGKGKDSQLSNEEEKSIKEATKI